MESTKQTTGAKKSKLRVGRILAVLFVIVFIGFIGLSVWQFTEINRLRDPNHTTAQSAAEAQELKDKVGKLIQLPDEEATVATVEDASKLADQEFFANALNGDKVLIFTESKKAVLYRPSTNMVINSGPVVINSTTE